tara:strand:- start:5586 stop:5780 length:195 start_codon:yes stop_codon:yes gene_type:complete
VENKKEIKLPVAKRHDEIEESVAQLKEEASQRQQVLLATDGQYRDIIGRIAALQWVLSPEEEEK